MFLWRRTYLYSFSPGPSVWRRQHKCYLELRDLSLARLRFANPCPREPYRERGVNCHVISASHQSALLVSCIPPISAKRGNKLSPLSLWGSPPYPNADHFFLKHDAQVVDACHRNIESQQCVFRGIALIVITGKTKVIFMKSGCLIFIILWSHVIHRLFWGISYPMFFLVTIS